MKTAIVGLGPHGKRLLKVVLENKILKLVGVVDLNRDVLGGLALDPELKFASIDSVLEMKIDVLLIATNGPSHASLAIKAMEAGVRYVLVEKPMACSLFECNSILEKARLLNVRLAVNKINRFDEVYIFLKKKILGGEWGTLRSIYIQKPGIGLGCLGTHSFDLVNYLSNENPISISAWLDAPIMPNPRGVEFIDPGGLVILRYKGFNAIVSQIEDGAGPNTIEIHLTGARIFYDPKNSILDVRLRDLTRKVGPGNPPAYFQYVPPESLNLKGDMIKQLSLVVSELIGADNPMICDGIHGRNAFEVLVASYLSHSRGNVPVSLPLTDPTEFELYLPVT